MEKTKTNTEVYFPGLWGALNRSQWLFHVLGFLFLDLFNTSIMLWLNSFLRLSREFAIKSTPETWKLHFSIGFSFQSILSLLSSSVGAIKSTPETWRINFNIGFSFTTFNLYHLEALVFSMYWAYLLFIVKKSHKLAKAPQIPGNNSFKIGFTFSLYFHLSISSSLFIGQNSQKSFKRTWKQPF